MVGRQLYTKDVVYLALLASVLSPKTMFEIGTLHGYTALLFALNTPPDTLVYTLDLPRSDQESPFLPTTLMDDSHIRAHAGTSKYLYDGHRSEETVRQLYADSAQFDSTLIPIKKFDNIMRVSPPLN